MTKMPCADQSCPSCKGTGVLRQNGERFRCSCIEEKRIETDNYLVLVERAVRRNARLQRKLKGIVRKAISR